MQFILYLVEKNKRRGMTFDNLNLCIDSFLPMLSIDGTIKSLVNERNYTCRDFVVINIII